MDIEQALTIVNQAIYAQNGRYLSDVEQLIFKGAWHQQTYEQIAETHGYSVKYLKDDSGRKVWKLLSQVLGESVGKTNFRAAVERFSQHLPPSHSTIAAVDPAMPLMALPRARFAGVKADWGEAIDIGNFYGRTAELATLSQWIVGDRCRLVALLGMGGIGKTALSVKLAHELLGGSGEFDSFIWRSVRNAPPLETLLADLVLFLSNHQETQATLNHLVYSLRETRCLIILDNLETILEGGDWAGQFRSGYEAYADLLQVVGETQHQSCLVLTSREKPAKVAVFEGVEFKVRTFSLSGSEQAALAILQAKGLVGSTQARQQLADRYSNSPLALKIVSTSIQDLFGGNIHDFLDQDTVIFNGIRRLLDQQFERLSPIERTIMIWLAINREWTSISELQDDIIPKISKTKILEALESLSWRSLIERKSGSYSQQPVVMEYVTEQLTEKIFREVTDENSDLDWFFHFALAKTTVEDYVRNSQLRLILHPIASQLLATFGGIKPLEPHILHLLQRIQQSPFRLSSYGGGNVINLCTLLRMDLTGYDFSRLAIWHANLSTVHLHHVNFSHTNLTSSVFAQKFGSILTVAFSPDSQLLATGDSNNVVCLWQVSDGQPRLMLKGHGAWVRSVAWSPDGQWLASGSEDLSIRLWDRESGSQQGVLLGHDSTVRCLAWHPDGQILASCGDDSQIRLWQVALSECHQIFKGHSNWVMTIAWHPDGTMLASGSADHTIRLWDIQTGLCRSILVGHEHVVWSVAWSPDGSRIVSASEDHTLKIWDPHSGECIQTLEGIHDKVFTVAWSPDGQWIASGSEDHTVRIWDPVAGQCLKTWHEHQNIVWAIAWSRNGTLIASGSHDQTIRLWDVVVGQCLKTFQGYSNSVFTVAWSPDGQYLASSSDDQKARLWDVNTGQCWKTLEGHHNWIWGLAWSPDGRTLATGSDDRTVRLWAPQQGRCLKIFEGHEAWVWAMAWHPDSQTLASGAGDRTVRIWDVEGGRCLRVLTGHSNWVWGLAWSPNGKFLASSSTDQTIRLWDPNTGECLTILRGHEDWVQGVGWSPDGQTLASSSFDQTVRLWDPNSGECLKILRGHRHTIRTICWSPDGKILASGSSDRTIRLWTVATGECIKILEGHSSQVWSVAWNPASPEGVLASSSADETIKLWDPGTGLCFKTLQAVRPYEGLIITGVEGISDSQRGALQALGAVETAIES